MKIVNIIGGLGNQMFQYAFALSLKNKYCEDVLIDIHHFNGYPLFNGYEIGLVFKNASLPIANKKQIRKVSRYVPHYKLSRFIRRYCPSKKTEYISRYTYKYIQEVWNISGDCYYEGYWQSYKFFDTIRTEIIKEFQFPIPNEYNLNLSLQMSNSNSVGIHVRRGDYVNNSSFGGICDEAYYKKAITLLTNLLSDDVYFFFSNDTEWCKDYLVPLLKGKPFFIVDGNKGENSFFDMFLMTKCKNLIIANSTFSWWGAYLNCNNGVIIAPHIWNKCWEEKDLDILLPSWKLI